MYAFMVGCSILWWVPAVVMSAHQPASQLTGPGSSLPFADERQGIINLLICFNKRPAPLAPALNAPSSGLIGLVPDYPTPGLLILSLTSHGHPVALWWILLSLLMHSLVLVLSRIYHLGYDNQAVGLKLAIGERNTPPHTHTKQII